MENLYVIIITICGFGLGLYWAFADEDHFPHALLLTIWFFVVLFSIGVMTCPQLFK